MFTPNELKRRALDFSRDHESDADEKSQAQTFWRDFFAIFGLTPQRIGVFEARAKTLRDTVGFIDFFWPGTLLIEHKSRGKDLEAALQQALDYCRPESLKEIELPRFIIVCDFARFSIVELATGDRSDFLLEDLHANLHLFNFVLGYEQRKYKDEDPVNIAAAELMGALHDELRRVGYEGHPLELFLVRLMFCFFADDTGIFQKDQFSDYIEARTREDGSDLGPCIAQVFRILDTEPEKRLKNISEDLSAFPHVNGELFKEAEDAASFDSASRDILLHCARFNWGSVSPAIFGSLFQSVMESGERRALGAHYTSEKNILKTIHGLFLDEFMAEFDAAKAKRSERALRALLDRIAGIRLLDPACGCGNFLILAYRELRRLEIQIHAEIRALSGDETLKLDVDLARGITIDHISGIEISEFPAQIARVALWIMDHLMNVELAAALGVYRPSIPLVVSPKIVQGNALRMDWKEVVGSEKLAYILGNPPFVGKKEQTELQKADMAAVYEGYLDGFGVLDYVTAWYIKAANLIQSTEIKVSFVSTNSITQGEQVGLLWNYLFSRGIKIHFAHRTFKWSNEAKGNAAVHVVIIGFGAFDVAEKSIYEYETVVSDNPQCIHVKNINPYLVGGSDMAVTTRSSPICEAPNISYGSMANDGGFFILETDERDALIADEPGAEEYIRQFTGGDEFINGTKRWCIWMVDADPTKLRKLPLLQKRIAAVREYRLKSKREATRRLANTPALFGEIRQPGATYILIPKVSSENRRYIPIGFYPSEIIASGSCLVISTASMFHFGILESDMHMSWMRQVCGRMKSDYQYSNGIVYNNYPWPVSPEEERIAAVASAAQAVLDARAQFSGSSLADLYALSMPSALAKAHKALDSAVDKCYRKAPFRSELERVEYLFSLYEHYCSGLTAGTAAAPTRGRRRG